MNKILGKLLIVLLLLPTISLAAVDIIVRSDRNPVNMDESFQLVFEANGSVDDDPDFAPLRVLLDVIRQSESSNISLINGTMSRSKKWVLTVMPKALGDVQIPSISFGDDKSLPLLIKVKKADQAQTGDSSFFVNLESDVSSSIEQAQIIATIRVFSDKSLNEISLSTMQFNHGDVVIEVLGDEKSFQTKIQGKDYLVIEQKIAIFPQTSGPLVIQPVLAIAEVRKANRRFFGDPATKPVRARSDSLKIDVQAKPDVSLWLPTSSLTLKDEWLSNPSQFIVGEPITRVLTLTAKGLTAAQLPELDIKELASVKMYPDQDQLKNSMTSLGIVGIRQEKIAYIPSKAGEFKLPAMQIPWWNTQKNQWEKAQIAEQIITVKPSLSFVEQMPVITQTVAKPQVSEPEEASIVSLIDGIPSINTTQAWWKWIALFFVFIWLITLWFLMKKPRPKAVNEEPESIKTSKPKFKLSAFKTACQEKNAKACKDCLIDWASTQFVDEHFNQLSDLKAFVDKDFYSEIAVLEKLLYSNGNIDDWNADSLYQQLVVHSSKTDKKSSKLDKNLKSLHLS